MVKQRAYIIPVVRLDDALLHKMASNSKSGAGSPAPPPAFSYAQAAKGRSASVPSTPAQAQTPTPAPAPTPAPEQPSKSTAAPAATESSPPPENGASKERRSSTGGGEDSAAKLSEPVAPAIAAAAATTTTTTNNTTAAPSGSGEATSQEPSTSSARPAQSQPSKSTSTSPTRGGSGISTAPAVVPGNDDEAPSMPSVASDPGWDKQSQLSAASADEPGGPNTIEKAKRASKDHQQARTSNLVAAPVPPVNFWQQRIEAQAQASKVKAKPTDLTAGPRPTPSDARPTQNVAASGRSTEDGTVDKAAEPSKAHGGKGATELPTHGEVSAAGDAAQPQESNPSRDRTRNGPVERNREEAQGSSRKPLLRPNAFD